MALSQRQESVRTWILLGAGLVWCSNFMFANPTALTWPISTLIAVSLFGPGILSLWKGKNGE